MPAYQTDAVTGYLNQHASARPPPSTFDASMRAYPDVVALAWGVPMVTNGTDEVSGGTSASAPVRCKNGFSSVFVVVVFVVFSFVSS